MPPALDISQSFQDDKAAWLPGILTSTTLSSLTAQASKPKKLPKDPENGTQASADKSFYENLPFHGLKSPPKKVQTSIKSLLTTFAILQVLNPRSDDHLDYADADYKDVYAEGPLGYKAASQRAASQQRDERGQNTR